MACPNCFGYAEKSRTLRMAQGVRVAATGIIVSGVTRHCETHDRQRWPGPRPSWRTALRVPPTSWHPA